MTGPGPDILTAMAVTARTGRAARTSSPLASRSNMTFRHVDAAAYCGSLTLRNGMEATVLRAIRDPDTSTTFGEIIRSTRTSSRSHVSCLRPWWPRWSVSVTMTS